MFLLSGMDLCPRSLTTVNDVVAYDIMTGWE